MDVDNDVIIAEGEQIVAAIGSKGSNDFFAFLTERRLYFKGDSYSFEANRWLRARVEGVVALENISATKFMYTQDIGCLVIAIIMAVLTALTVPGGIIPVVGPIVFVIFAAITTVCFIKYARSRKSLFWINFPGGGFAFEAFGYQIGEIRHFQRMLHLLKDKRRRLPTNKT